MILTTKTICRAPLLAAALALAPCAIQAQTPLPPSPEALAKYDTNKDGLLDDAETAAMQADEQKRAAELKSAIVPTDDEIVELSPFTVSTQRDIGYRASNTLAGSRLNSKIEDLAAPITVITKQQLEDTGAHDLNDVFLYEANTEGSLNYTKIQIDRSGLKDNIGGSATSGIGANTATTANRIRGLINADMTWNYYPSIARVRADTYNVSSMEISRGPNSILGGLGSPAGILNQSLGTARLDGNTNEVNVAIGSYGSYRTSLALNRTFFDDKVAVYLAGLYDDREFSRKPSYDVSRRQTLGITYKPFKKTTIKGFMENYRNNSRLPNQLTPRDGITPWLSAGRPTWDPLTRQVTYLDTGVTTGAYMNSNSVLVPTSSLNPALVRLTGDAVMTDRRSEQYVAGLGFVSAGRPVRMINPDGSFTWTQAQASTFNIYPNPLLSTAALRAAEVTGSVNSSGVFTPPTLGTGAGTPYDNWSRRLTSSALNPAPASYDFIGAGVYIAPSISDKKLYNWEKVNISAANHGEMRNSTYNLELEQQITPELYFSGGWFRQDLDSLENYPLGQLATTTVLIDTNKNLPSGQANPNYLRPFVDIQDPDTAQTPESKELFRSMLAYDLDFTKNNGWSRWLGRHRLLAFAQHEEDIATQIRYRFSFVDPSDPRFLLSTSALPFTGATGGAAARAAGFRYAGNASSSRQAYYIGDSNSIVSYGPATNVGNPAIGTTESSTITAYNYQTGRWEQANVTYGSNIYDAGGGFQRSQKVVNSYNFTAQSYWWKDRIITTMGVRHDKWMGRQTTTSTDAYGNVLAASTNAINAALYPVGSWVLSEDSLLNRWAKAEYLEKTTKSLGIVVKPLPWIYLHANGSDNFNPPPDARVDIFGKKLPTPTGKSKDFGFTLNILDEKLIARVTFFDTRFKADRNNPSINTMLGRLVRQDTANLKGWAEAVVRIRSNFADAPAAERQTHAPNGSAPTNTWTDASQSGNALSAAQQAQVTALLGGLPYDWPGSSLIGSTQDAKAKGAEFEIIYNPLSNWNIKLTAGKQSTTYSNIIPEYESWIASRMPVWTSAAAPDMAATYAQPDGKTFSLQRFYSGYGFGETNGSTGVNGFNPEDWFTKVVAPEFANARQLDGAAPYGQRKWRVNVMSNYQFTEGFLKRVGIGGAIRWEDKAVVGYRGKMDANGQWTGTDETKPVYDTDVGVDPLSDLTHFDFWVSYRLKMWNDKIRAKVQLNLIDAFEPGSLAPIYVNFDGTPAAYRIVDSRHWQLSVKFEF